MNDSTITIYNYHKSADKTESWQRTVIHGVSIKYSIDKAVSSTGVITRSQVLDVIIPIDADTQEREYIDYRNYLKLTDTSGYWTVNPSSNKEYIVSGEIEQEINTDYKVSALKEDYAKSGIIKGLSDNTDMPMLKHYKVVAV